MALILLFYYSSQLISVGGEIFSNISTKTMATVSQLRNDIETNSNLTFICKLAALK